MSGDVNQAHLEKLESLPEGWADSSVAEIVQMISANNKKLAQKKYLQQGEFPVIDQGQDFIGGYSNDKSLVVEEEPPFIVFGDHTRAFKFANFKFVPGADGVKIMKPLGVDPKWCFYIFQAIKLPNKGYARHFQYLKESYVPVPPPEQQKRIVAILDQTFADIEQARAKTEQNLKNARELFESSLQKIFKSRGESWERVSLLELLDRKWITSHLDGNHGGDYPRKSEFVESGVPYISAKCLINGEIDMSRAKYLMKERAGSLRKGIAKNEDVLFAHNATVGPVAILDTDEEKVILGTSLTYYRCNKDFILPEYLAQYMVSYEFTSQYTSIMRQSTRNQVPITKQREFIHVIPPIEEQADIAESLVELSSQLKQLELTYQKKQNALEQLKQSILKKPAPAT